jgi:hypothetical protein
MARIQIKRGLKANLPSSGMLPGEQYFTTDRGTLHIALTDATSVAVVPAIEELADMPSVASDDYLLMHDTSETVGQKEKKIAFSNLKEALNIGEFDTDEKVAVTANGQAGYLWGTNGNDGVIRPSNSVAIQKDINDSFVQLAVGDVDFGTF